MKRVFNIDTETCKRCKGQVKIIVEASNRCIEDPAVIERILAHLKDKEPSSELAMLPEERAPPQARLGVPVSSTDTLIICFAAPFGARWVRLLAGCRESGFKRLKTGASGVSWR